MAIAAKKITPEKIAEYGVCAAPDTLRGTADENKKVFDRLVREIVAKAVNAAIDSMEQVELDAEQWAEAENGRKTAETSREAAETVRVENENTRITEEAKRQAAEEGRITAEQTRNQAEIARIQTEQERKNAELARESAESTRANAEQSRVQKEAMRVSAEQMRISQHQALMVWDTFDMNHTYEPGNKVVYNGQSYLCIAACTSVIPEATAYWRLIAAKGEQGERGVQGETGPQGTMIDLKTGVFGMCVSEDGHLLVVVNEEQTTPPLAIDPQTGHLLYHID